MLSKARLFRSKFRTFRIWFYLLFGFGFFFFSSVSAFATSYDVYSISGSFFGSSAEPVCSAYASATFTGVVSSSLYSQTSGSFTCEIKYTNNGPNTFSTFAQGTISSTSCTSPSFLNYKTNSCMTCPSGTIYNSYSGTCEVPYHYADGEKCHPQLNSPIDKSHSCTPSGQVCTSMLNLSMDLNDPSSSSSISYSNVVDDYAGSCTYTGTPSTPLPDTADPNTLVPPVDLNSCGSGSISVGGSCYPSTGSQCGTLNGTTVCVGGASPIPPINSVTDPATGKAVTSTGTVPPPNLSGDFRQPPYRRTSFDVYSGFSQGGGALPTSPPNSDGTCPSGYGTISSGSATLCVKDGSHSGGSGSGSDSGSGDGSSHCGGSGQPPCGNSPDDGAACPTGTSQITVDRGQNGTDSVFLPVADPNTIDTSGLDQTSQLSSWMTPPNLSSLQLGQTCACPSPYQFSVFGQTLSFPFSPFCDLADMLRPLFIFLAWVSLYFAVVRVLR